MDSFDADLSALTLKLNRLEPKQAVDKALELRADFTSRRVREDWGERLFDYRTTAGTTAACGPVYTQVFEGNTILGDVHQDQKIMVARSSG